MSIDDFVSNRWADAKEALRKLDPDFVDLMDSLRSMERMDLWAPPDMHSKSEKPPKKLLPKKWHELLEACFELTVITRHYQDSVRNMTSLAVKEMSDFEAGRLFMYSFYTWVFYQDAVIEHTKTAFSLTVKIYKSPGQTPNQLKKRYHQEVDTLKKATEETRNAIVHGGGFISRALTEDRWWEHSVAIGILPCRLLDEFHYVERGQKVHSGYYDEIMETGPQVFLEEVARILHDFEQEIVAPS